MIDPVTAILNLMTAVGLLAVASLVRPFPPARLSLSLSHRDAGHVCFRGVLVSYVADCIVEARIQVSPPLAVLSYATFCLLHADAPAHAPASAP